MQKLFSVLWPLAMLAFPSTSSAQPVDISRSVGNISIPTEPDIKNRCVASIIEPGVLVTATHCVESWLLDSNAEPLTFMSQYNQRNGFQGIKISKASRLYVDRTSDIAMFRVDSNLPKLSYAHRWPSPGDILYMPENPFGSNISRTSSLLESDGFCGITIRHSIKVAQTDSGSPIMIRANDGRWKVIAIHSGGDNGDGKGAVAASLEHSVSDSRIVRHLFGLPSNYIWGAPPNRMRDSNAWAECASNTTNSYTELQLLIRDGANLRSPEIAYPGVARWATFHESSELLAVAYDSGIIDLWRVNPDCVAEIKNSTQPPFEYSICWQREAISQPLRLPDRSGLNCISINTSFIPKTEKVLFSCNNRQRKAYIGVWTPRDTRKPLTWYTSESGGTTWSTVSDGNHIYAVTSNCSIIVWSIDGAPKASIDLSEKGVCSIYSGLIGLTLNDRADSLVVTSDKGFLCETQLSSILHGGNVECSFLSRARLRSPIFSRNGTTLILASSDKRIHGWKDFNSTSQSKLSFDEEFEHTGPVRSVDIHDGAMVISSVGSDKVLRFWDIDTGRALGWVFKFSQYLRTVDISPDGRWTVVTGYTNGATVMENVFKGLEEERTRWKRDSSE